MANVSSFLYLALVFSLGLWGISCTPDYLRPTLPGRPPIVTTLGHQNPAVLNCSIRLNARVYDGEESLEEIGFLLSSTPHFTENGQGVQKVKCNISGNVATIQGEQLFTSDYIVGPVEGVTRYYKAYGKNSTGIGYGQEYSYQSAILIDVDNNPYNSVQIGTQCWTRSNLKVSKYRDGTNISTGLNSNVWQATTSGAYSTQSNDPNNDELFGKLYNYYAVTDSRGICPTGWHVPTEWDWNVLVKYLDSNADTSCNSCVQSLIVGGALKSTATLPTPGGWPPPNTAATNSSGFSALPGGLRSSNGDFNSIYSIGWWWSSSVSPETYGGYRVLSGGGSYIERGRGAFLTNGFSVRCCRD